MLDPLWDIQLSSDHRVSEQGDLSQGEAVGGQPVGEHRLRFDGEQNYFRQLKSKFFRVFMMFKLRLTHYGKKKTMLVVDRLTVGKLMVRGRMMKGMILNTVFMARRLGLSIPDSAPNYKRRHVVITMESTRSTIDNNTMHH